MPPAIPIARPTPAPARLGELRRLPGQAPMLNPFQSSRLWLGADSLWQVEGGFCRQEFRRFAFRDIQALEICASSRWWVYQLLLGVPLLILGLVIWGGGPEGNMRTILEIFAGGLLGLLIVNVGRGPTCDFIVQTVLGPQRLPSLRRRRPARVAIALIGEQVARAQREA